MNSLTGLRGKLKGRLYAPSDAGYASAKRGKGTAPTDNRHPAMVVQAEGTHDVARTIEFARANDIELSVRSGGHDMLGASTTAGGIVLDLCRMNEVDLTPSTGLVRVGGGARAGVLFAAGNAHGLAPMLGMSPSVGIGGLTLGGGIGWLSGAHGAAVDHVLAVEVVTADGERITANADDHPDLFWALRGGGGNFGVATAFTLRMQPVARVLGGDIGFKVEPERLLRFMREFLAESGDALDTELQFTLGPDPTATIRLCWSGDSAEGDRALRSLRGFAPVVLDNVGVQPFAAFVDGYAHAGTAFLRGGELNGLTDDAIGALAGVIDKGGPEGCGIGVLHCMHGALCRVPEDSTPFIRPPGHILYNIIAPWQGTEYQPDKVAWAMGAYEAMRPVSSERTYLNYLCEEGEDAVRRTFGPHYDRLRTIKHKYDPQNFFHNNRNIPSSGNSDGHPLRR